MKTLTCVLLGFSLCFTPLLAQKPALSASILEQAEDYWQIALKIWDWAEPGYQEVRSSELLATRLEASGFIVERGVADIPTAFTATFGSGKPVIGILGEFDALPGLAQEGVPERSPLEGRDYGHGCGHHLFGTASAAAAIALSEQIRAGNLKGTVRFYGTPAEEGGGAKVYMVREGLFQDVDAVIHWHPSSTNGAGANSNLARIAAKFRFHGTSAHAANSPDQGRSALDAVELTGSCVQLMREHIPDFSRIHYVITNGGGAPNVVPALAEAYYYVRHPSAPVVRNLFERVLKCAQAGALGTETRLEVENHGGVHNLLPNDILGQVGLDNLRELNDLSYDSAERDFAEKMKPKLAQPLPLESLSEIEDLTGVVRSGSTDVGDVSWVVPTVGVRIATWVPGTPSHSWQATACGHTTIARKGMLLAARTLAAIGWDLFSQPDLLVEARRELDRRLAQDPYKPMLEPGQKPRLDYRN